MQNPRPLNSIKAIGFVALVASLSGCASIVHNGNRNVTLNTAPTGAKATIVKADTGEAVSVQTTPFTVSLDPKRGYFKGQAYQIKLELAGYQPCLVDIKPSMSGWYIGNIVFGGLIGLIVVDPLTGAMWNLSPEKIEQPLTASHAELIKSGSGFVVMTASELTANERAQMVRIN
jgi:hypothetical protein